MSGQPTVQVIVQGVMTADTMNMLAPTIAEALHGVVQGGQSILYSTTTTRPPNRTAGR